MATVRYKVGSPYTQTTPTPPSVDLLNTNYERNLRLENPSDAEPLGFALFGVGRAGTIHLSFLVSEPSVDLLYIIEDNEAKWGKLKKYWKLNNAKFLTSHDADAVYKDPKVRAVVVCSPTFTHEEIVKNALENGKAVFCEKPIGEDYERTKSLYEKAKQVDQPLLSAFNRRFDPSYSEIKERVRKGAVGEVHTIKVCSRDSPLPSIEYLKTSGGIFHDCAVHDIDIILYVLGEYPTKVTGFASAKIPEIHEIDDFDTVGMVLYFDSGTVAMISLSRHSVYGYDQRLEVFGAKGMLKAENQQPIHNVEFYSAESVKRAPILYSFPSRYSDGYVIEMRHFVDVLLGKTELCIDSKDTLAVTRIASACEEAVRTGKVVELKWAKEDLPLNQ